MEYRQTHRQATYQFDFECISGFVAVVQQSTLLHAGLRLQSPHRGVGISNERGNDAGRQFEFQQLPHIVTGQKRFAL